MHWILGAILHATLLGVIGFFVLFAAGKAEGFTALLGRVLGYWILLLAVLSIVGGVSATLNGGKPFGMDMMHGRPGWTHHWGPPPDGGPEPAAAPAPAKPPAKP